MENKKKNLIKKAERPFLMLLCTLSYQFMFFLLYVVGGMSEGKKNEKMNRGGWWFLRKGGPIRAAPPPSPCFTLSSPSILVSDATSE